jgi:hypothetical protein
LVTHCSANFDLILRDLPYLIIKNGIGRQRVAIPAIIDIAGPTPRVPNMGRATNGIAAPKMLRKKVFADTALAA